MLKPGVTPKDTPRIGLNSLPRLAHLTPGSFNPPEEPEAYSIVWLFDGVMVDLFTCSRYKIHKAPVPFLDVTTVGIPGKIPELFCE